MLIAEVLWGLFEGEAYLVEIEVSLNKLASEGGEVLEAVQVDCDLIVENTGFGHHDLPEIRNPFSHDLTIFLLVLIQLLPDWFAKCCIRYLHIERLLQKLVLVLH